MKEDRQYRIYTCARSRNYVSWIIINKGTIAHTWLARKLDCKIASFLKEVDVLPVARPSYILCRCMYYEELEFFNFGRK